LDESEDIINSARDAIAQCMRLYNQLSTHLLDTVESLKQAGRGGAGLSEEERATIRELQKSVMMVLDFEQQLFKRSPAAPGGAGEGLDLDAARAEVLGRLDRLAERGAAARADRGA
jgi:hypothetical protein